MRIFVSFLFLLLAPSITFAAEFKIYTVWKQVYSASGNVQLGQTTQLSCPTDWPIVTTQPSFQCGKSGTNEYVYFNNTSKSSTCPTNTTYVSASKKCVVNSGYSYVYNGTFNQATGYYSYGGTYLIKPIGTECLAPKVYNSTLSTCDTPATTNNILPLLGGIVGIALAGAGLVVSSPLLLAGGLAVAAHSAILGIAYKSSIDTSKPTAAANALAPKGFTFELDPTKSLISPQKNDNTPAQVVLDSTKKMKPKGGNGTTLKWTQDTNNNHVLTENNGSGQRTVATIDAAGNNATAYRGESEPVSTFVTLADDNSSVVIHSAPVTTTNPNTLQPTKTYAADTYNYNSDQVFISEATYMSPH